ncbi:MULTISPECIES: cytochrome P450 [unclassified Streptomyces]|uniref:cytochrome P450 n=1 Tax=unclassified Streptomyces TaxID=2593676 RepID=UPI00345008B5
MITQMGRFRRDPLGFIEDFSRRHPAGVFRLPWGSWCVGDTDLARVVLRSAEFNSGLSPFFGTLLPSRSAQVGLGRAERDTLQAGMPQYRAAVAREVDGLPAASQWPEAAVGLVYRGLSDLLLHPDAPPGFRRRLEQAVHGGLMARRPTVRQRAAVEVLRNRLRPALIEQVGERRKETVRTGGPRDVLDSVLDACPKELTDEAVTSLYLLLFRSLVGVTGYSVAWSVLLAALHHTPRAPWPWPADRVVREAARHRPVVWMVGRAVPRPMEFAGHPFETGTVLSVSPYLLHHDEHHWNRPEVFRPERWDEPGGRGFYLPYSAGPFVCAGASLAHDLITEAVSALTADSHLTVTGGDTRPIVTDSTTPRPFTLHRTPRTPRRPPARKKVNTP